MSRIPGKLIDLLEIKLRIKKRAVYRRIEKRWNIAGKSFSKKIAALSIAAEVDIDPGKFATKEELEDLRDLQNRISGSDKVTQHTTRKQTKSKKKSEVVHIFQLDDITKEFPINLANSKIQESFEMAKAYCYLYILENSIRKFILEVMSKNHGKEWWKNCVKKSIQDEVVKRMKKDKGNRWHGSRKAHPIYYADVEDYRSIMTRNQSTFKPYFPDLRNPIQWIQNRIEEITLSRNIIAHMNPLGKRDRDRLVIYIGDWLEQIG